MYAIALLAAATSLAAPLNIAVSPDAHPRVMYGANALRDAIVESAGEAAVSARPSDTLAPNTIVVGAKGQGSLFDDALGDVAGKPEGFALICKPGASALIAGADAAGALYGCLELAERIKALGGRLPDAVEFRDAPKLLLRGPCLGLQRPETGSDGVQYDFPYLPETFPWFYDRALWTRFLDLMARYRFNALYLWNGHPFTSLLALEKYPEAQEIAPEQLQKNIELFTWLCAEADRRNIWVVQNFYNIHISHAFARAHNIAKVHSKPSPLVNEYSTYCITEFIKHYPHVGLMMCLGEALDDKYDAQWLTEVIIPGVRAGLATGQPEPPIIVRSHSTPIFEVMAKAKPLYANLYAEAKYNNESVASDQVGGGTDPDVTRHYDWEAGGQGHVKLARETFLITNVHCVANLEPFRWGSPDFVRRAMTSCVETGLKGLHLFPLRYWDWPYSADRAEPRLLQPERDWIWYATWARYAWNPYRDKPAEDGFWVHEIAARYGSDEAAKLILDAYEASGEVMPYSTRAFAITTENYLANTMGQTLPQLFQSKRWYAPRGETIALFAQREAKGEPHVGETPPVASAAMVRYAARALDDAERAAPLVTRNQDEFARFRDDICTIDLVARFYAQKVDAAIAALIFLETGETARLDQCLSSLGQSVATYRQLAELTARTYLDCAGRHDSGRRYPYPAPEHLVWSDMLPEFEKELDMVKRNADVVRAKPEASKKTMFVQALRRPD